MSSVIHTLYTFQSLNEKVVGDLYLPTNGQAPYPTVVSGPGFGGVKEIMLGAYAGALADAGIACLVVDFVGYGASSGTPRQDIRPFDQVQTLRDALTALGEDPEKRFDVQRLGIWGTSLCGAHALVIAATDPRIKAAVAIIPHIHIEPSAKPPSFMTEQDLDADPLPTIQVFGKPGDLAVMTSDGSFEWSEKMTKEAPSFKNEVTIRSLRQMVEYNISKYAKDVNLPLLVLTAVDDSITPAEKIHKALQGARQVEIKDFPGTHFELFSNFMQDTVVLTVNWLKSKL
ncbi:alpha/beta-hydrolase [Penicillium malachiteum]|uniref:Alpha/beta-hydrolase n=1 Tax=Penicillium malachiteum TaxID=1324776 RepID=A0AAD6HV58_9EURO|nr:alpha/beta-hydrolase [Penicillium malachiteum]